MTWLYVILAGLSGGLLSLLFGVLLMRNKNEKNIMPFATAFAAGTLLAAAFFHIIPESLEQSTFPEENSAMFIMMFVVAGFLACFVLEAFLHQFHSHAHDHCEECTKKTSTVMIIVADTIHNFLDGISIAAGFLISPITGLVITLSVIAHEIPQEMGDIAIMRSSGLTKKRTISLNIQGSFASLFAAVLFYAIGSEVNLPLAPISAIIAGFFIYIATTDIIPTLQQEKNKKSAFIKMFVLFLGIIILWAITWVLHPLTEGA
ncbi:MAG: ZIP family metal transporter [Christensenellaceae bacterium]|jgi:zinc and cadmium transporter|nr:ZIP family metal transporter [Christensenellaceae bacterium]